MWIYEKKLQYPVNIRKPDPAMAKLIITCLLYTSDRIIRCLKSW